MEHGERIANEEHQKFVVDVGHAIQNFGAIELLINHMLSSIVTDRVLCRTVIELPVTKRIAVLEQLLSGLNPPPTTSPEEINEMFAEARSLFRERNKIAHNPFVALETPLISGPVFQTGILVIRFHEEGRKEEWIDLASLKTTIRRAHALHERLHQVLDRLTTRARGAA